MEQVSHEFLAELAKTNNPILNNKPLQEGNYNIAFDYQGYHYTFSQVNGYWNWTYKQK